MIREIMARPQEIAWLPWAVQYFFFIGLACGSVVVPSGCAGVNPIKQSGWNWPPSRWQS